MGKSTVDEEELDRALEPLRRLLDRRKTAKFKKELTLTTKNNLTMEVHFMASIDFESLKKKVSETLENVAEKTKSFAKDVADKSSDAAKNVAGKASDAAKKAKLNVEIASARNSIKEKYTELGKLYYEKYAGNTDPDFAETAAAIEAGLALIEEKQTEIEALDAQTPEPEAEETMAAEEEAGLAADEVKEAVEAAAEKAAEVHEDVVDAVNDEKE